MPSSAARNESVTPASNQQIIPADEPHSSAPRCHAVRSASSIPCSRQIASAFAVLPPLTSTASALAIRSRASSGGTTWSPTCEASSRVGPNSS